MNKMGLYINYDMCDGCHSCEMACAQEHKLPVGQWGIRIMQDGPRKNTKGKWEYTFLPLPTELCNLCTARTAQGKLPACVHHCQTKCMEFDTVENLQKLLETTSRSVVYAVD
jgi:Fe-S-cluster-containing dehydrogenase component